MKITISKSNKKQFNIFIPNKVAYLVIIQSIRKYTQDDDEPITMEQKKQLSKFLKDNIKNYKNWQLVEVLTSRGEIIEVYI